MIITLLGHSNVHMRLFDPLTAFNGNTRVTSNDRITVGIQLQYDCCPVASVSDTDGEETFIVRSHSSIVRDKRRYVIDKDVSVCDVLKKKKHVPTL